MRAAAPILALLLAAAPAAAQDAPVRPPPRDTVRFGEPVRTDSIRMIDDDTPAGPGAAAAADPAPRGGSAPFSVQATGRLPARPPLATAVYGAGRPVPRVAARDTAPARDTIPRSAPPRDTAAAVAGPSPASAPSRAGTHVVRAGDTFFAIARRYGVTSAQLRAVNPDLDPEALEPGDVLRLPATARDSLAGGAAVTAPAPVRAPAAPPAGARSHVVEAGETLFGIARRHGVTIDAIRRANGMETDQIRVGQRLVIPASP
jgi:LysM repeat protein